MTGQECSGDECGYYRDGAVAYREYSLDFGKCLWQLTLLQTVSTVLIRSS